MGPQYIYIMRAGGGVVGVFLYLLIRRQCMIRRRVPVAMATIVHYVHYNRLRVPFRLWQRGVTRRNNNDGTTSSIPF